MAHEQDQESCFSDQLLGQVGTLYPGPPELRAEVDDAGVRSLIVSGPGPVLGSYPTAALHFLKQKRARDGIIKAILEKYDWKCYNREGMRKRKGNREKEGRKERER